MMLMIRKGCVVILVVLILASLTIGSINPIGTAVMNHTGTAGVRHMEEPGIMTYAMDSAGDSFTTVTLDMAKGPGTQDALNTFMVIHRHDMIRPNDYMFIIGNMTLHHPGEKDRSYPVQWVRGAPIGLKDGLLMASFIADMNVPMPPMADGFPPTGGMLAFHSVINVTSPILTEPTAIAVPADEYNDQISQGQTVWHQQDMTGSSTTMNVDLKWQNSSDSLRLMIYTPDGHVLGPYYDSSDNKLNGEINLTVSNPAGVASGAWSFKVTGMNVSTSQEGYYLRAW